MINSSQDANQTQFIQEEPLFEDSYLPQVPQTQDPEPTKPWYKQPKKIGIVVAITVLTLVLVLLLLAQLMRKAPEVEVSPTFNQNPTQPQTVTEMQKRLRDVQADLESVDPAQDRLPLPPVLLTIGLPQLDDVN